MIINTVEQLTKLIEDLKKEGNLLYPLAFCDSIAPMHKVSVRRLSIDSNPDHGEVYHPKQVSAGKYALTKIGLLKIDLAAGLDWISQLCHRTDNGMDQFYCKFTASAKIQDLDGSYRTVSSEYTLDYRDNSISIEGLSQGDIRMRRMSIVQRCETAAKNRVRRDALGLRPVYTVDELKKPFIVFKLVKDIPQRYDNAVAASLIGVDRAIFGDETKVVNEPFGPAQTESPTVDGVEVDADRPISKEELIEAINKLYIEKLGHPRTADRQPLEKLGMDQLQEVMKALIDMEKK